jgi:hypothetical protein
MRSAAPAYAGHAKPQIPAALSENEQLLIVCVRKLALAIADGARDLAPADADQFIAHEVFEIMGTLSGVSEAFSNETARYLTDAVRRLRQN